MNNMLNVNISTCVSFAVCLFDDFTAARIMAGNILFLINGKAVRPVRKNDGYFVFVNLPEAPVGYNLTIISQRYLRKEVLVKPQLLDPKMPVIKIKLLPSAQYGFNSREALIMGRILYGGKVSDRVKVSSVIASDEYSLGKLRGTEKSSINLYDVIGRIISGDCLLIREADESKSETCVVKSTQEGNVYELEEDLKFKHSKSSAIMHVLNTSVDEKGEFVIYSRDFPGKSAEININIKVDRKSTAVKEVMESGQIKNIGLITFND